ncbi:MAG: M48 family metalloprotease [Fimbriimonadales bacterium]|nr:M48 family metalloprotease [Fimbriimonadales bacterium]
MLTSPGVLALGGWILRARAPFGRTARRLRRLLWLSILWKLGTGTLFYATGNALAAPLWGVTLLLGAAQVLGEFALIFRWLYPLERTQRGLTASLSEYLQARLRLVGEAVAPILTAGLGALTLGYVASGQCRADGASGALMASGMGLCALLIGLGLMRRPLHLPVRPVPVEAHLLREAQRLGREVGVSVRELLVLDGTRLRSANAFALSGGRIAVSDYLLASLTEQEVLAVLAHEVAHLALRRRLMRLWWAQLGVAVGVALLLAPLWERLPSWGLLAWLGLIALWMATPMLRLRQRHERAADAFAVSQYGVEPLASALQKIAHIHCRQAHERGDAVHPALNARLNALKRFQRPKQFSG